MFTSTTYLFAGHALLVLLSPLAVSAVPRPQTETASTLQQPSSSSASSSIAAKPAAAASAAQIAGVGVQLFQWPFVSIMNECTDFLGPNGYAWVQTSPVQRHVNNTFDSYSSQRPWYAAYQPLSYNIGNRLGTQAEFQQMVSTCNSVGVSVVVDVVLNHAPYVSETSIGGYNSTSHWTTLPFKESLPDFGAAGYNASHFHTSQCNANLVTAQDFANDFKVYNCRLATLADIKTEDAHVRQEITNFLNTLIGMGVSGFRVDAAKHVPLGDWLAIIGSKTSTYGNGGPLKNTLNGARPSITLELFNQYGDGTYKNYEQVGNLIGFDWGRQVGENFRSGNLASIPSVLQSLSNQEPSHQISAILENHDIERNSDGDSNFALSRLSSGWIYKQASVLHLLYPYSAQPLVHSGYFTKYGDGNSVRELPVSAPYDPLTGLITPITGIVNNSLPGGTWMLQHRWSDIFSLVRVRNFIDSTSGGVFSNVGKINYNSFLTGPSAIISLTNQIVYWTYSGKAFVFINSARNSFSSKSAIPSSAGDAIYTLQSTLKAGTYCNMVYGHLVAGQCQLWPGTVLKNKEQVVYNVDSHGMTTTRVLDADASRVLVLYAGPDGGIF